MNRMLVLAALAAVLFLPGPLQALQDGQQDLLLLGEVHLHHMVQPIEHPS